MSTPVDQDDETGGVDMREDTFNIKVSGESTAVHGDLSSQNYDYISYELSPPQPQDAMFINAALTM